MMAFVRMRLLPILIALILLCSVVGPVAAAPASAEYSPNEQEATLPLTSGQADPGEILTLELANTTDANDNGKYSNFDLYIEADTRLPAGNDDSDGDAEPRLQVIVDGVEVYDRIEVSAQEEVSGEIPIPKSVLPDQDKSNLEVTVVLWDEDVASDDILDQYTITVPYEADESGLELVLSRTSTVVGSPVYIGASGGEPGYQIAIVDQPTDSQTSIQSHTSTAVQFRPDAPGTYVIEIEDNSGETVRAEVTVRERSDLIDRYAPVLNFDREEEYRPTRYEAMVENSNLYEEDLISEELISDNPSMFTLGDYVSSLEPVLDLDGNEGDYRRYDDQYPPTVYASVHENVQLRGESYTAVTYWMFYVYDPKTEGLAELQAHQSDLETVTVFINDSGPQYVAASQHKGGELREWEKVPREGTHLQLYPALGAHSSFLTNTDNYDGEGLLGQEQFALDSARATTTISGTAYQDTTGSDRVLSPTGDTGTEYEIVPLTGNEVWADFSGGFASDYDSGQVPMQRERWENIEQWAEELPSDEAQRDVELSSVSTDVTGDTLDVTAQLENIGPKPDTFHVLVYAKPSEAGWDSADVTFLGSESVPLGTRQSTTLTTTVQTEPSVEGNWDIAVLVSIYDRETAEQEDILTQQRLSEVYRVDSQSTTTSPTTAPPTTTTEAPSTTTPTEATTSTPVETSSVVSTTEGNSPPSTQSRPPSSESETTSGQGSPGFTGVAIVTAMLILGLRSRYK